MVKIGGPVNTDSHNDRSARKYLPSKRGCLKFGCLIPLGLFLIMMVIGVLVGDPEEGSDDDTEQATQTEELHYENIDTSIEDITETTDDNVDYTAWTNPERFNMTNEEDDYFLRSIKIEGLVAQILVEDDIYFLSVAMDGYDERPVLVTYDSNITTPSFEIGDNIVIEGVSIELFDAGDGTYYPAMMAFSYSVK